MDDGVEPPDERFDQLRVGYRQCVVQGPGSDPAQSPRPTAMRSQTAVPILPEEPVIRKRNLLSSIAL